MKFDFDDIDAAQQTLIATDADEHDQFWAFIQRSLTADTPGAVECLGGTLFTAECERSPNGTVHLLTPIPDKQRALIERQSKVGGFAARGIVTDDIAVFYFGPDFGRGRLYVADHAMMHALFEQTFPDTRLTAGEKRLVLDLVVGYDLRGAAERDGSSYETKRTLLKRALSKTEISSQNALLGRALSAFLIECHQALEQCATQTPPVRFRDWVKNHLDDRIRCHTLLDENDDIVRLLDLGPKDGQPVLIAVPTIFPHLTSDYVETAREMKIRLLLPLRRGSFMDPQQNLSPDDLRSSTVHAARLVVETFATKRPIVAGFSNACSYAVSIAADPEINAKALVLISPLLQPKGANNAVNAFRHGFIRLAEKSPRLRKYTLQYAARKIRTPEDFKRFLMSLTPADSRDHATLFREFSNAQALSYYHQFVTNAFPLFLADNYPSLALEKASISQVACPIHVVRGEDDVLNDADALSKFLRKLAPATETQLPNCGSVIRFDAFDDCIRLFSEID